jgi:hypothetical protein
MDDTFIVTSYSAASRRHAILADDGRTGILYLHAPSDDPGRTAAVEATSFAFNRIDPIDVEDVPNYRPGPPPIAKGYASPDAICREPGGHEWQLLWSADGESVALLRDGVPWAVASVAERRGFSKAIQVAGPWGRPWSVDVYSATQWG